MPSACLSRLRGRSHDGKEYLHGRAEVLLGTRPLSAPPRDDEPALPRAAWTPADIYSQVLFHGPAMQGIRSVEGSGERGIAGRVATSPAPSRWLERPLRSRWITDPLAIDCAFQLVVLWTRDHLGASSLPTAVGRYRQFRPDFGEADVRVVVAVRNSTPTRAVADVEFLDARGELIARIESYECVVDAALGRAFRRNQLAAPSPVNAS